MTTPTVIDVTPAMIERAAQALLAEEAQDRLTDCYGKASKRRAEKFARAALEAALEMGWDQ